MNTYPIDYGGVIFDLDDTLYPSRQHIISGCKAIARYVANVHGIKIYDQLVKAAIQNTNNNNDISQIPNALEYTITTVLSQYFTHVEDQYIEKLVHVYNSHTPALSLHREALVSLAILRSMKIHIVVMTNGAVHTEKAKIKALGLHLLVDSILHSVEMLGDNKMLSSLHLARLQIDEPPAKIAYVSSSKEKAFYTAQRVGMKTIHLNRNHQDKTELKAESTIPNAVDFEIPSLAQRPELLITKQTASAA